MQKLCFLVLISQRSLVRLKQQHPEGNTDATTAQTFDMLCLPYPGSVQQDHAVAVLLSLHDCNYHLDDCRGRRRRQTGARAYISLYVK